MPLTHCILHKLERPVPAANIQLQLRDEENSCSDGIFSLFEQLKHSLLRSSQKRYGQFDTQRSDYILPGLLQDQQAGNSSFTSLSQKLAQQLQELLEAIDEVFSIYLLFAIERVMEQDYLYILWLDPTGANQINTDLEVQHTQYIDTQKLSYALKVHINEWADADSLKYLTLLASRGNQDITQAFTNWAGFTESVNLVEDTKEFLAIVDQYTEDLPEDKLKETKTKILDYCVDQDRIGSPVIFEELSQQVNESSPEDFSNFVREQQEQPKTEIFTDRSSLKRYLRFFGRDKNMSISFSADIIGEHIEYDEQNGTLVIKQIPKSLRQQLSRYQDSD